MEITGLVPRGRYLDKTVRAFFACLKAGYRRSSSALGLELGSNCMQSAIKDLMCFEIRLLGSSPTFTPCTLNNNTYPDNDHMKQSGQNM
eukprot:m.108657 g.108657  ORF g.108657 m.108657 type:complete len:89 (+) comp15215_c0_seq3:405-671(+)